MEGKTNGESPESSPAGTLCPSGFDLPKTRQAFRRARLETQKFFEKRSGTISLPVAPQGRGVFLCLGDIVSTAEPLNARIASNRDGRCHFPALVGGA